MTKRNGTISNILSGLLLSVYCLALPASEANNQLEQFSKHCSAKSVQYLTRDSRVFDSIEFDTTLPENERFYLDRNIKVNVSLSRMICDRRKNYAFSTSDLANPDAGKTNDIRSIKQTNGDMKVEYQQRYSDEQSWVTTKIQVEVI